MTYHVCLWIDHHEAKIFGIGLAKPEIETVDTKGPRHHIHRKADHVGLGTQPASQLFLEEVATALGAAKAILIAGPGEAKTELARYLRNRFPAIAERIWGMEPMDHPNDAEIVDAARRFFRAADRMHA